MLTAMLALLFIISPLLADRSFARWFPDQAGSALYSDATLTTTTGTIVLIGWIVAALIGGVTILQHRDA